MSTPLAPLYDTSAGLVWRYFAGLCQVPRPSRHEAAVLAHLRQIGESHGWDCRQDTAGNLVLGVPGRGRLAQAPILILQSHVDMVCEKLPSSPMDFLRDPIQPRIMGDWVRATDTTLGADDGMGVALSLALASAEMPDRVPLELLFTVDEETGLNGAQALDAALLHGRRVLNLDSEEDGVFTIGCAGGIKFTLHLAAQPARARGPVLRVSLGGLRGGHSGVNIHEGRGNALRAMASLLVSLAPHAPELAIHDWQGGNKRNAIPRDCTVLLSGVSEARVRAACAALLPGLLASDPGAQWDLALAPESQGQTLPRSLPALLLALPNGVLAMDPHYPELVQTSNNLSVVTSDDSGCQIELMGRSSVTTEQEALAVKVAAIADAHGTRCETVHDYPGWAPRPDAPLLRWAQRLHREVLGSEARVMGIHAGLETGILGQRLNCDDLLSYGPTIENAHSPTEQVHIPAVARSYSFLSRLVSSVE